MHYIIGNILEKFLGMSVVARDRILRAYSDDGLHWVRDLSYKYDPFEPTRQTMHYFVAQDRDQKLWFRSSIHDKKGWYTLLRHAQCDDINLRDYGIGLFLSPVWLGKHLFGISQNHLGGDNAIVRVNVQQKALEQVDFENLSLFEKVEDITIMAQGDGFVAFVAGYIDPLNCEIHKWVSDDGLSWTYECQAVTSPFPDSPFQLASNPCLIRAQNGLWRLYFRSGTQPAINNSLHVAESKDLKEWHILPQTLLSVENTKWESGGLGFPFVYYDQKLSKYVMYYAGFWGNSAEGKVVEENWQKFGRELLKK